MERVAFLTLAAVLLSCSAFGQSKATVTKDPKTSEVTLANERLRIRFRAPGPGKFKIFPKGYTGYAIDLKTGNGWATMASVPYFTSYVYRSGWGRDWLHYVIPQKVELKQEGDSASAVFSETQLDFDQVKWEFLFTFALKPGSSTVDVTYTATPERQRPLILFWGPKLYAGEGTFGAAKDEALFPGLEYLGPKDRSGTNPGLAPDAKLYLVPNPVKVTIPMMTVVQGGRMVGLMWDPLQKWNGSDTCPSSIFASPNWLEDKNNHLMGLFLPGGTKYVPENGLRAHNPAVIEAGQSVTLKCKLFAGKAASAMTAVDLYLAEQGGLPKPQPKPMEYDKALEMYIRSLVANYKDGWEWEYGSESRGTWLLPSLELIEAAPLLKDRELAKQADELGRQVIAKHKERPLTLALRVGDVPAGLGHSRLMADIQMKKQHKDGSWRYVPTDRAEGGLSGLKAPPQPGEIAPEGVRSQGITASELAPLWDYVLVTNDQKALKAAMKGLAELDRYSIPFTVHTAECPPCPSLHGAYMAARCYLAVYRVTGEQDYLDRAVYWAKTGLPFIYLWSLGPREVTEGYIHGRPRAYVKADQLWANTRRDPMLYGGLFGYGSSQFSHHWLGILVHWIPLCYADTLPELQRCDRSVAWNTVIDGILTSALWQVYDKPPYTGFMPDAFNLESWEPSGVAFSAARTLQTLMPCIYGSNIDMQTEIARYETRRCHITSAAKIGDVKLDAASLSFTLQDKRWPYARAIISDLPGELKITADGKPLPKADDLESLDECWTRESGGLVLVKIKMGEKPRAIGMGS